jgi:hypothetical protein
MGNIVCFTMSIAVVAMVFSNPVALPLAVAARLLCEVETY